MLAPMQSTAAVQGPHPLISARLRREVRTGVVRASLTNLSRESNQLGFLGGRRDALLVWVAARPEIAAFILLACMSGFLLVATPTFATYENLIWVCYSFAIIGIATIGLLLVLAAGDIDISIGAEVGLAAVVAGRIVFVYPQAPDVLVFGATIITGMIFGFANGLVVAKLKFNPFIATLATGYVGRGLIILVSDNRNLSGFSSTFTALGAEKVAGIPILVLIFAVVAIAWSWVLTKTVFGRQLFAVGGNASAARLSGVEVDRVRILAFVSCGCMAGLAGFLLVCRLGVAEQSIGVGYEMDAIAAAVIGGVSIFGGTGSVVGVVVGTAAMAVIRNGLVLMQIGAMWQLLATGSVIVIAIALDGVRRKIRPLS
jgi:ribose transport system permease protein